MSRRSKSATRRLALRKPRGILSRIRNSLPSASTAVKALVALGIPTAAAYALHKKYPNAVEDALESMSYSLQTPAPRSMPSYTSKNYLPGFEAEVRARPSLSKLEANGIGGVRRRRVRKPALLSELSSTLRNRSRSASRYASRAVSRVRSRSKSGRGEGIGGVRRSKRPLTAYQKFVKKHRKPGVSLSQVAKMWRNR